MSKWLTKEQEDSLGPVPVPDGSVTIEYLDDRAEKVYFQELQSWNDGVSIHGGYRPFIYMKYHTGVRIQIPRENIRKLNIQMNSEAYVIAHRAYNDRRDALIRELHPEMEFPPRRMGGTIDNSGWTF